MHVGTAGVEQTPAELFASRNVHYVQVSQEQEVEVPGLFSIHRFCEMLSRMETQYPGEAIVVCPKRKDPRAIETNCFLMGAYLILRKEMGIDDVLERVKDLADLKAQHAQSEGEAYVKDGLRALYRAKHLSWLDQKDMEPIFDVEMCAHYSAQANGNVHVLVPGKVLLFPTPEPLPHDQAWVDVSEPGCAVERRFSAAYLADVLTDLGVAAVVCLGECDGSAAAGLEERGLDVHHLGLDPRQPSMLQVMDWVLAVAREAPGAVAVCSGEGCWGGEWRGVVGTLAAAYLMRELGFDAGAADAWVRMACAEMSAGQPRSGQCRR